MRIINRLLALCCALIASTSMLTLTGVAQEGPISNLSPPPLPLLESCELKRSPAGVYTLHLIGRDISEGDSITINGARPKKVKIKGEVDGQPGRVKIVIKGGLCGSLPGIIVATNPVRGSGPALNCNQRCRG